MYNYKQDAGLLNPRVVASAGRSNLQKIHKRARSNNHLLELRYTLCWYTWDTLEEGCYILSLLICAKLSAS